ncbi:hypothetical protein GCM10022205_02930 [Spinactinospora alkalitolerans]
MLGTLVGVAGYAVLLVLGFVAGIVCGLSASWLAWLWQVGPIGQALAVAALVLLLVLLFLGCRVAGWGMGSRLGAGLPAAGWAAAGFAIVGHSSAGDVVMTAAAVNYGFLYGGITAVVLATVLTPPAPVRRPQPTQNWNSN